MLNDTIRITIVMMAMRSIPGDGRMSKNQLAFCHMRRVLAQQWNDAAGLGDEKQPNQPRAQPTPCGLADHLVPDSV
jgi:hypothetical protein